MTSIFQTLAYIFIWFYVRAQPWWVEYQFVQVETSQYFANIFKLFYQIFSPELVPAQPELRADQRVPLRQRRLRHRRNCLLEGRSLPEAALLKR